MNELFRRAESPETAARLTIASGAAVFERALRELEVTKALRERGAQTKDNERAIASRIADLVSERIDGRYRHPHDVSLSIYLYVLYALNRPLSLWAADAVREAPNCFWSERVAAGIRRSAEQGVGRSQPVAAPVTDSTTVVVRPDGSVTHGPTGTREAVVRLFALEALRARCRGSWRLEYPHDHGASQSERAVKCVQKKHSFFGPPEVTRVA